MFGIDAPPMDDRTRRVFRGAIACTLVAFVGVGVAFLGQRLSIESIANIGAVIALVAIVAGVICGAVCWVLMAASEIRRRMDR